MQSDAIEVGIVPKFIQLDRKLMRSDGRPG